MQIAITGSVATDHLMTFPGLFNDSLMADHLHNVSLSFLVDDLQIRRGGVAANICFGMGVLGGHPLLVAAVGHDFADYKTWLVHHGVNCDYVHTSLAAHTARFMCTTDQEQNQIASFYPGAMSESTALNVAEVHSKSGGLRYVLIGADDPAAMLQHSKACKELGIDFIADPSQQLPRLDGEQVRAVIEGAALLFNNEYEASLIEQRTGWSADEVLAHVGVRVTTLGKNGARIQDRNGLDIHVPVAKEEVIKDPTGVGDAFRAGFLMGLQWGKSLERCAQIGSLLATYVIETVGTQEFVLSKSEFLSRLAEAYGDEAVTDIQDLISCPQP
ncbi:MAG: carbohydrate kinase family protein [Actinomycetales bacterium]|nr:carbohydrate kinase family protein [Actinomycetales bacterium]